MKNIGSNLGRAVIFSAFILAFGALHTFAQGQSDAAQVSQTPRIPARVTQAVDDSNRVALRGNVHRMARAEFDRGAVSESQLASRVDLLLKRSDEQEAALRQLLDQQQDKSSPNYHKWLTPDQFGKQFGPADSDIQAVTDWLTSRGFTGIKVSPGRTRVEFSGNIGQINSAFQTQIHHFYVGGKMHSANVSDPQIPAALSPVVRGVASLHDFRPQAQVHRLGTFRRTKDTNEVKPLFTFGKCGSTTPCYAVGPGDFAKIYNIPATISATSPGVSGPPGTGVTIAIVQDSNINPADVADFQKMFGLTANPVNVILNGPDPGIQGPTSATDDEIEADLDVQWAGAVAPGATIDLVVSEDSQSVGMFGTDLSAIYIVDNNIAPVLSESFGSCEASIGSSAEALYVDLWEQASAQGITAVISAGDNGSAGCDPDQVSSDNQDVANKGIAVSGIASTGFNVALGGTDFQNAGTTQNAPSGNSTFWNTTNDGTQTSAKGYIPEWPWNDSCAATATSSNLGTCTSTIINGNSDPNSSNFGIDLVAGSGGPSTLNAKPVFQTGINGMPSANFRQLPDISFFSGNGTNASFYVICQQDANTGTGSSTSSCDLNSPFLDFQGVGGTSAAAPAFAGVMAMINQQTGKRQGNANYVLYQLYKNNAAGTICASAASPAATCIFYDTVTGNNSVACAGGTANCSNTTAGQFGVLIDPTKTNTPAFTTTTGYDNATGLGSLNITKLLAAWSSASFNTDAVAISSTSPSPVSITHGTNATFHISLTPTSATGVVSLTAKPSTGTCVLPGTAPPPCSQVGIGSFSENSPTVLSGGAATITTNELPGGTSYQVVANYAGDGTFAANTSAPVTVTVTPEPSKTAVGFVTFNSSNQPTVSTAPASVQYGSSYILQIAVTNSSGQQCATTVVPCPTGTVTLTDNGQPLNDFSGKNSTALNSVGIAEDQPVQLSVGTHSLVATYSGDNSFATSTSAPESVTITTTSTTTAVTTSPSTGITTTAPVTITAKINTTSTGAGPTGSVVFTANGKQIGNAVAVVPTAANTGGSTVVPAFATASITNTFATTGSVAITSAFTPAPSDHNYSSSNGSDTIAVGTGGTVATTTTAKASVTTIASGGNVTLTATVTGSNNNGPGVTGTVQFMNGTQALGTAATCTATAGTSTTPGTCTATLSTALSNLPPGLINPAKRTPQVPPAVPLALASCILALLVFVIMRHSGVPTRRRLAYAVACALVLVGIAAGLQGCGGSSSTNGGGTHVDSITAVYSGDATYVGSTSAAVAVTVTTP
ncbi:MAG: Ig-like domain repeat protein [Acidobacteria bacterium]|nr:Ig-like domain repeat protein [Acidobacteriota bacterium]